jgi:hypothetical protein
MALPLVVTPAFSMTSSGISTSTNRCVLRFTRPNFSCPAALSSLSLLLASSLDSSFPAAAAAWPPVHQQSPPPPAYGELSPSQITGRYKSLLAGLQNADDGELPARVPLPALRAAPFLSTLSARSAPPPP